MHHRACPGGAVFDNYLHAYDASFALSATPHRFAVRRCGERRQRAIEVAGGSGKHRSTDAGSARAVIFSVERLLMVASSSLDEVFATVLEKGSV